jgi:Spy/CpxP family protein refolding chaperone
MKRAVAILLVGVLAAVAGYGLFYYFGMQPQRALLESPAPELAWLRKEFHLSAAEFERVAQLHDGYMPRCAELCRRIAQKNAELQQIVASPDVDGKAVERKLKEAGDLRVECQQNMFNHFLEVSRQMPPEQGKRYLQWVQQRTLTPGQDMAQRHEADHGMKHH